MAKSFLAEQITEIREGLRGLAGDVQDFNATSRQMANGNMRVVSPGGPGGGGSIPTILGPNGSPIGLSGSLAPTGSIAEWLAARKDQGGGISSGAGGGGQGGSFAERPPTQAEKAMMTALGEGIEYVRMLAKAAAWARLDFAMVLRSPKAERDALIAAFVESGSGTMGSKSSGGAGGGLPKGTGQDRLDRAAIDWMGINPANPFGPMVPNNVPPIVFWGGGSQSGAVPIQPGSAADKNPTAGDKFVAEAVGKVGTAIDKLAAKIDTQGGLGFRKMGI